MTVYKYTGYRCNNLVSVRWRSIIVTRKIKCLMFLTVAFMAFCYLMCMQQNWEVDGWNRNTPRNAGLYILPNKITTLMNPYNMCKSPLFLLVIVCSAPRNLQARNAIRFTWALDQNVLNSTVKVYFLVGQPENLKDQWKIAKESRMYDDIIQEDFDDTYNNLTIKSLMLLKIVKNYCAESVRFVLKADDDLLVMMDNLVYMLQNEKSTERLLIGHKFSDVSPYKFPLSKWYTSKYMYSGDIYPDYLSGNAYVMSIDTALLLFETALHTPIFHLEDVYLTGICSELANIEPRHNRNFYHVYERFDTCTYKNLIAAHYYEGYDLVKTHLLLKTISLDYQC